MSEDALLSAAATLWTSKAETFRVLDEIEGRLVKKGKSPEDVKSILAGIRKPKCRTCSEITSYIVENVTKIAGANKGPKYAPSKPLVGFLLNYAQSSVYLDNDQTVIYIPVTQCHRCAARADGFMDGKYGGENRTRTLARLDSAALTFKEKEEYRAAYSAGLDKGTEKFCEFMDENPKSKGRFKERK